MLLWFGLVRSARLRQCAMCDESRGGIDVYRVRPVPVAWIIRVCDAHANPDGEVARLLRSLHDLGG